MLHGIELEGYEFYTGYVYDDIMKENKEQAGRITALINIVVWGLLLVIGVGWLNSVRGMLLSGRGEYQVLRLLGMSAGNVRKICRIQVLCCMLPGIAAGAAAGHAALCRFFQGELAYGNEIVLRWNSVLIIVAYFLFLTIFLRKTIRGIVR